MLFSRWHPEVALRYLPIVDEIKSLENPSVLEIGSGSLGIAPYLGRKVTGLDTKFSPPFYPLLERKSGFGQKIPFADKSFDVVICVDILEHVKPSDRQKIISQMRRVARKEIVVAVPSGQAALEQDKKLDKAYKQINKSSYHFFDEHFKQGLPSAEEIKVCMGKNVRLENNEPLFLRDFLMRGWMHTDLVHKVIYWKLLLLALPLFRLLNKPPFYRIIFYEKL